eukprot:m.83036 g.83036  ORF g.83036 m.83036 type:complete len:90 (+) comp36324_c0_seq5:2-271(+)
MVTGHSFAAGVVILKEKLSLSAADLQLDTSASSHNLIMVKVQNSKEKQPREFQISLVQTMDEHCTVDDVSVAILEGANGKFVCTVLLCL